jgi:hypothetical protein
MANSTKSTVIKKRIAAKQNEWLEAFKNQWTIAAACRKIGIDRTTYYIWAKKYPNFVKQKEEIEEEQIEEVESKLKNAIERGDLGAIIFYLKCRSEKWRPWEKREVEGKIKSPQLKRIAKSLAKIANYDNEPNDTISDKEGDLGSEGDSPATLQK